MHRIPTSARSLHNRSPASKSKAKAARVPTSRVRAPPANAKRQAKPAPVKVVRPFQPASDRSASARRSSAADATSHRTADLRPSTTPIMLEISISVLSALSCADGSPTGRGGYFIERAGNEPSEDNHADRGCGSQCGLRVGPAALRLWE